MGVEQADSRRAQLDRDRSRIVIRRLEGVEIDVLVRRDVAIRDEWGRTVVAAGTARSLNRGRRVDQIITTGPLVRIGCLGTVECLKSGDIAGSQLRRSLVLRVHD